MARYINSYSTAADVQSAIDGGTLNKPYVAYIENDDVIDWNSKNVDYSKKPLTFDILSSGVIYMASNDNYLGPRTIEYKLNDGAWTSVTVATGYTKYNVANVSAGDKLQFRGNNNTYGKEYGRGLRISSESGASYNICGNIMSLINSTGYTNISQLTSANQYCFAGLFIPSNSKSVGPISAENLILPNNVVKGCYYSMFEGCRNLTTAPVLPATTLAIECYEQMFRLFDIYTEPFHRLKYIKCLATDISATSCTSNWLSGSAAAATGTFVTPASTNWASKTGSSGIPTNWTRVDA